MARVFRNVDSFKKWKELAEDNKFKCTYCGCDLLSNEHIYAFSAVEHFIPRSKGGTQVVISCGFCNKLKRDRVFGSIGEAREELKKLREEYLKKYEFKELRAKYRREKQ